MGPESQGCDFHQLSCTGSGVSTWPSDYVLPIFGPVHPLINSLELPRETVPKEIFVAPPLPLQCICTFQSARLASPGPVDSIVPEMP